ncbi:MAG: universal stress protein [Candidatus Lambdaproteobacteria bacterium]|nr:universal stress protein [Candidatus Lambdaproteobacteria bacterium]
MFKKIVFPTDITPFSESAFGTAAELARSHGASLHILYVLPDLGYGMVSQYVPEDIAEKIERDARAQLHAYIAAHDMRGLTYEVALRTGIIYEQIVDYAQQLGADLIVLAGHNRSTLGRFVLGSNAERVVRHAHCAVMVLRPVTL